MLLGASRPPAGRLPCNAGNDRGTLHRVEIKHALRVRNFRGMQSFHVVVTASPSGSVERPGVHHRPARLATLVTPPSGGTAPSAGTVPVDATFIMADPGPHVHVGPGAPNWC
jgi:hypothetical protein